MARAGLHASRDAIKTCDEGMWTPAFTFACRAARRNMTWTIFWAAMFLHRYTTPEAREGDAHREAHQASVCVPQSTTLRHRHTPLPFGPCHTQLPIGEVDVRPPLAPLKLLTDGHLKLDVIAREVWCRSKKHCYHAFTQRTHIQPSAFRRCPDNERLAVFDRLRAVLA